MDSPACNVLVFMQSLTGLRLHLPAYMVCNLSHSLFQFVDSPAVRTAQFNMVALKTGLRTRTTAQAAEEQAIFDTSATTSPGLNTLKHTRPAHSRQFNYLADHGLLSP